MEHTHEVTILREAVKEYKGPHWTAIEESRKLPGRTCMAMAKKW